MLIYQAAQPHLRLRGRWQLAMPQRYEATTTDAAGRTRTMVVSPAGGQTRIAGKTTSMPKARWQEEREQFYLYYLATLLPLEEPATRLRLATTAADTTLYQVVEASRAGYAPVALYFDRYTHLLSKLVAPRSGPNGQPVRQELELSSYQEAGGGYRPFHVRITQDGQPYCDLRLHTITNQGRTTTDATTFTYPRQPLRVQVDSSFRRGEVQAERLIYSDQGLTKTSAWRVRPAATAASKRPAILYLHWGGGDKDEFLEEALEMAERGFVSLLLDAPFAKPFGPRRDLLQEALPIYREGFMDMLRGVDLLQTDPAVDSTRLYVVGHSYGAHLGGALAGLRPALVRGCVLVAGTAAITRNTERSQGFWARFRRQDPAAFRRFLLSQEPLNAQHYLPAALAPALLQYGRQDEDIDAEEARLYAALWPTGRSETRWYEADHRMQVLQARQDRVAWLSALEARTR